MQITVLGSGTSHGVPMIGCHCAVCTSSDPKNRRYRPCLLVVTDTGSRIVVDTPPEFRLAVIENNVPRVDAVLYTHSHADHIFGLDDLRAFNYRQAAPIPLYAEQSVLDDLHRAFRYCFIETEAAGGKPQLDLTPISAGVPLSIGGLSITPLRVRHGRLPILAFKFGQKMAYVTDVSRIDEESEGALFGLDVLFLDAVRREPHPTHFHLDRALEVVARLAPKQTYFVHLSHDYEYSSTNAGLPPGVALAYDGLTVSVG